MVTKKEKPLGHGSRSPYSDSMTPKISPSWNPLSWPALIRAVRRLETDQYAAIPAELRPPPGKWLDTNSAASWSVPLDGTVDRQEVLESICQRGGYEARPDQPMRGWLAVRRDEADVERVAVLVGTEVVGFLRETESAPLRSRIKAQERRGKSLWVAVFFEVEDGRYVADVSIP
jgi:hypothetical protein